MPDVEDIRLSRQDARPVRRVALLLALPLALATPSASAREQAGCAHVSAAKGPAPFAVSFTASCAAAAYHWDFGDGAAAATAGRSSSAGSSFRRRRGVCASTAARASSARRR